MLLAGLGLTTVGLLVLATAGSLVLHDSLLKFGLVGFLVGRSRLATNFDSDVSTTNCDDGCRRRRNTQLLHGLLEVMRCRPE